MVRVRMEESDHATVDVVVTEALASARDESPAEVDVRLRDHLCPDALQRLYDHAARFDGATWRVEFAVGDDDVTVHSDGWVAVT